MDFLCHNPSSETKKKNKRRVSIATHRLGFKSNASQKTPIVLEDDPYGSLPTFGPISTTNARLVPELLLIIVKKNTTQNFCFFML